MLAHSANDQQVDAGSAQAVNTVTLADQVTCQKRIGRAVAGFAAQRIKLVDGAGSINQKYLRDCLELAVAELADGIVGDVPVCGNGIVQPGELCDDGNTAGGDGCSATCTVEPPP